MLRRGISNLIMSKHNGDVLTTLDSVDIKVREGEVMGLLGPNGAGKSTLIKILCTLIMPTSGEAYVNGYNVTKEGEEVRSSLGYVTTDERSFYWRLTGRENLDFYAALHNLSERDARQKVDELLSIVQLKDRADDLFLNYSAGMKQRMAIARGLINDPQVLFMDEPTRSLDPSAAKNLRDFIKEKIVEDQGKTIFMSTHNLDEAEQLCDRVAILDEGRIRAVGSPGDLKAGLGEGSTLCDVFSFFSGRDLDDEASSKGPLIRRAPAHRRGGLGMRRRGF